MLSSLIYQTVFTMTLSKKLNFIWFGSSFPIEYQKNISSFKFYNPNFKILLWVDYESLTEEEIKFMELLSLRLGIELRNIRNEKLLNQDLIILELNKARTDRKKMARIHFVRASDIARVGILFAEGGIYYDTDSKCIHAIPENILLPHGFLSESTDLEELNLEENPYALLKVVFYHFMAAIPNNRILELTAAITRLDYDTYNNSTNKRWESLDDRQSLLEGNIKLTGTSLKWALNYLLGSKQIKIKNLDELFFDSLSFAISSFDKSWLKDFPIAPQIFDESLNDFCTEIESHRQRVYPLPRKPRLPPQSNFDTVDKYLDKDLIDRIKNGVSALPTIRVLPLLKIELPPIEFKMPELPKIEFKIPKLPKIDFSPLILSINNQKLKDLIKEVSTEYINYSRLNCQYSIFHRHHASGRQRVTNWLNKLDSIATYPALQKEILDYLSNKENGNTHMHSFRMMLITRLCNKSTSNKYQFEALLHELSDRFITPNESPSTYVTSI